MLGLFTQTAAAAALVLLATFYVAAIPMAGVPEPRAEGAYLIVNKTLIEAAAVLVLLTSRTGAIAGLIVVVVQTRRGSPGASRRPPHESHAGAARTGASQFSQGAGRHAGARGARRWRATHAVR